MGFASCRPRTENRREIYRREAREIDAVLLDVRLPKKTGDQVFREMRTVNPAVKVVLASGYLDPKIKTDMTSAGHQILCGQALRP